jgi:hypothetical protein
VTIGALCFCDVRQEQRGECENIIPCLIGTIGLSMVEEGLTIAYPSSGPNQGQDLWSRLAPCSERKLVFKGLPTSVGIQILTDWKFFLDSCDLDLRVTSVIV